MNLHEYQAKLRFSAFGIPIPHGKIAVTPHEAHEIAREINSPVMLKAQILPNNNRENLISVLSAHTPEEAEILAHTLLNTTIHNVPIHKILVEAITSVNTEIYLAVANDRSQNKPIVIASAETSSIFDDSDHDKSDTIIREYVDPFLGLLDFQVRNLASGVNLPYEYWNDFTRIAISLYKCYVESDAVFAEINPLVVTPNHQLIALNCNLIIDDNALFRHPDLAGIRADESDTPAEIQARAVGLSYVQLNGQIGCMVNGAGLAMTMMDLIALYGGGEISSAGFLDIGGGASAKKVTQSLRILLTNTNLKAVLINIFGGITKCDEVAQGILEALTEVITDLPIIIRLVGTNADEGRSIINQASLLNLFTAMTLTDAARQVVEAARGKIHGNPG